MTSRTVEEIFDHVEEFTSLLGAAELNASGEWDESFTADLRSTFQRYGARTYLQSRYALSTEQATRVILLMLGDGVIELETEDAEQPDNNIYRVVKKPTEINME